VVGWDMDFNVKIIIYYIAAFLIIKDISDAEREA
jgi:hypothetical protein